MEKFGSVNELLDFAIEKEQEANMFYIGLAKKMERESMRKVFQDFAAEEQKHKEKLTGVKEGKQLMPAEQKVIDLKIGDYLVDVPAGPDMDYQDALILAMKKEKASFRLYTDLAATTEDGNLQSLMHGLAQEEAKHKLRLEMEYDEYFLTEGY
ncbi:MAG: ferritin family protein [Methanomassiliicoccales archaeon]|nr:MAG: ferritin family protein [Methanomassiliicoccales archaeon]